MGFLFTFPECTLSLLRQSKRFITTASFDTDTIGLKKALEKGDFFWTLLILQVNSYKPLMKDFPITQLLTLSEIDKLPEALTNIFLHLKKGARSSTYPIQR